MQSRDLNIDGIVQGVGFRPFVARLARELGLAGWVENATDGVRIHAEAPDTAAGTAMLDEFARRLREDAPPSARIVSLVSRPSTTSAPPTYDTPTTPVPSVSPANPDDETPSSPTPCFEIRPSTVDGARSTLVSPDLATCNDCLSELFDPANRRYHYPFVNCTNCGPRFTIIDDLPYDRALTSMRSFEMCEECADEYADEEDRRYHAQPDACFACGPRLWWIDGEGTGGSDYTGGDGAQDMPASACDESGALMCGRRHITREESDAIVSKAAHELADGRVVAVKGLGGWHLACDATNEDAVRRLRARKRRPTKPLAVMVANLDAARRLARVGAEEERLLGSPERPIVLLERRELGAEGPTCGPAYEGSGATGGTICNYTGSSAGAQLATSVAGPLPEVGVMLPATPLEHLLLAEVGRPLVMTSGNVSGEPIVATDAEALSKLAGVADGYLGNNRAIVARYDDSVIRVLADGTVQLVRRARGIAPTPIAVPSPAGSSSPAGNPPVIFAAGPEQKATIAWSVPATAAPPTSPGGSPGSTAQPGAASPRARIHLSQHLGDLETLGAWSAWEEARGRYERLFDLQPGAIACDMHPEYLSSKWARERAAQTDIPLIEIQHHHAHIASVLGEHGLAGPVIGVALDGTGYGTDGTIWGGEVLIADRTDFERFWHLPAFRLPGGEAAIHHPGRTALALMHDWGELPPMLEEAAREVTDGTRMLLDDDERKIVCGMLDADVNSPVCTSAGRLFDAAAALLGVCMHPTYDGEAACLLEAAARNAQSPVHEAAREFHEWLVGQVVSACEDARRDTGIDVVAASGGCLCNRLVAEGLRGELERRGFTWLTNRDLPPNDGCIAFGQAVVARARLEDRMQ